MDTVEINSSEFRQKIKSFFELASTGTQVIVHWGAQTFEITPVKPVNYTPVSPETLRQMELAREQAKEGKSVVFSTKEESRKYLESL